MLQETHILSFHLTRESILRSVLKLYCTHTMLIYAIDIDMSFFVKKDSDIRCISKYLLNLHRVFHSIRFKVNNFPVFVVKQATGFFHYGQTEIAQLFVKLHDKQKFNRFCDFDLNKFL